VDPLFGPSFGYPLGGGRALEWFEKGGFGWVWIVGFFGLIPEGFWWLERKSQSRGLEIFEFVENDASPLKTKGTGSFSWACGYGERGLESEA